MWSDGARQDHGTDEERQRVQQAQGPAVHRGGSQRGTARADRRADSRRLRGPHPLRRAGSDRSSRRAPARVKPPPRPSRPAHPDRGPGRRGGPRGDAMARDGSGTGGSGSPRPRRAHCVLRRNLDHPTLGRKASRLPHRMYQLQHKPGPSRKDHRTTHSITGNETPCVSTQPFSREQYPLRLSKRKESRGASDVLTFHARPQTTWPAHAAAAPCRLQGRADATDAVVLLTARHCMALTTGPHRGPRPVRRADAHLRTGPRLRAPDHPGHPGQHRLLD